MWNAGLDALILVFWVLSFKPAFSLSSFIILRRLSSSSSLSAIRVVSLIAQWVKNLPVMQEALVWFLGWEDLLEKGKATHSSILAASTPWAAHSPWGRKESDTTERLPLSLLTHESRGASHLTSAFVCVSFSVLFKSLEKSSQIVAVQYVSLLNEWKHDLDNVIHFKNEVKQSSEKHCQ